MAQLYSLICVDDFAKIVYIANYTKVHDNGNNLNATNVRDNKKASEVNGPSGVITPTVVSSTHCALVSSTHPCLVPYTHHALVSSRLPTPVLSTYTHLVSSTNPCLVSSTHPRFVSYTPILSTYPTLISSIHPVLVSEPRHCAQ